MPLFLGLAVEIGILDLIAKARNQYDSESRIDLFEAVYQELNGFTPSLVFL